MTTAPATAQTGRQTVTLMRSQVGAVALHDPVVLDGGTDLVSLCRALSARGVTEALVRDGDRLGIFTTTDLRDALLLDRLPAALLAREVAHFPVVEVDLSADLHQAMILMLRHRISRLLVRGPDGEIAGMLSQLDLLSFVAGSSQLIADQATRAASVDELKRAADRIEPLIALLRQDGVRVEIIAALVGELNRAVFRRLWELVAPDNLRANSCLLVMGSEGRGEQIIRTDQDNGLILRDGFPPEAAAGPAAAFTRALVDFGYPPCPGGVMVSNPLWRQPVDGFRRTIGGWLYAEDMDGPMNLAIFLDALPVAGDADLLAQARGHLDRLFVDNDAWLSRFAASVNAFADDRSWWTRLPGLRGRAGAEVDIKKLGIFPIVQAARALALLHRVPDLPTADRLSRLAEAGRLPEPLARDSVEALRFLMGVKLDNNLRQIADGRRPDNLIRLDRLGTLDRHALKDSLVIVRDLRGFVTQQFRLAG